MSDLHAQTVPYVRDTMLPPADAPLGERGVVRWMRANLFSSWFNAVLTVVSLAVIVWLFLKIAPWFANSVWFASSLDQCRTILNGTSGACFAVITERWQQMMYGFYPSNLYWRANLTLLLLFLALFPVLFDAVSVCTRIIIALVLFPLSALLIWGTHAHDLGTEGMIGFAILFAVISAAIWRFDLSRPYLLIYAAIFPFLMVWLVWGGTAWGPIGAALGFVIGWLTFRFLSPVVGNLGGIVLAVLLPVLWWLFLVGPFAEAMTRIIPLTIQEVQSRKLGGFMVSIIIGISGIALSLPIGVVLALGRQSHLFIVHSLCVMFIEFIRGVPLITLLFTASLLLNYFLPPGTNFDIILRVIIMVTLFASAYMAETIRGGLAALPKGQYEAADSLGLDYWKAQRLIVMPQALKISIPGIVNNFIGLFKDTTLVTFIGILDILNLTNSIRANSEWHGIYWELYIFVGLMFFITCFPMGRYSRWLEQRLRTDNH